MTDETQEPDSLANDPFVQKTILDSQDVKAELASNPIWFAILEGAQADELKAMQDLAEINAHDVNGIIACKIRIFTARNVPIYVISKIEHGESLLDEVQNEQAKQI